MSGLNKLEEAVKLQLPYVMFSQDEFFEIFDEIQRLKQGNFTEEEFQNLCHNFSEDDEVRFKQGCIDYQKKLFCKD